MKVSLGQQSPCSLRGTWELELELELALALALAPGPRPLWFLSSSWHQVSPGCASWGG